MEKSYNCCDFLTPCFPGVPVPGKTICFIKFREKRTVRKTIVFPDCCYSNIAIRIKSLNGVLNRALQTSRDP